MQDLKVSFIQYNTAWQDIPANLSRLSDLISEVPSDSDLLILPETFSTGFTMDPSNWAEEMDGSAVNWMKENAVSKNLIIGGSLVISENGQYYNRFVFAFPDGSVQYYNKRHLFSLTGEDKEYAKGHKNVQLEIKGWKIRPLVCYDLRFPVWSKNDDHYDLLIYTANWPEKRIAHWQKLLMARAIENQAYVLGVNRYGEDGNGLKYNGSSMLIDPMGETQTQILDREEVVNVILNYKAVSSFREFLSVLDDSDSFTID